jgi:hypothetical protein
MTEELVNEHRSSGHIWPIFDGTIFELAKRNGMLNDVPFLTDPQPISECVTSLPRDVQGATFASWIATLTDYLDIL